MFHRECLPVPVVGSTWYRLGLSVAGGTFIDVFVSEGVVSADQIDPSYDGSPARWVSENGAIAQQGFASAEPYVYENEIEEWAMRTLIHVASMDPDGAQALNGVGFSKVDVEFGHSLADRLRSRGTATPKQWRWVLKLARKYRRQAPEPMPEGEND